MSNLSIWLAIVLAVEALTNLVTKSFIFSPVQKWAEKQNRYGGTFLSRLLTCAYCLSVWVSTLVVVGYFLVPSLAIPIIIILCIHRLSNWAHHVYELLFWKAYGLKDKYD